MCGIVGYVGKQDAAPFLLEGCTASSTGGQCAVRCAWQPCVIRTCRPPSTGVRGRLHRVQFLGFLAGHQPDRDQVERADEAVTDPEATAARAIASRSGTAQLCSSRMSTGQRSRSGCPR